MNALPRRRRLPLAMLAALAAVATAAAGTPHGDVELARRIYQDGILPDGSPLSYRGAAGTVMSGRQAACMQCHRRSGLGSREGRFIVPPITGPDLYTKPRSEWPLRPGRPGREVLPPRHQARDAYDDDSLIRAVTAGIDASGRALTELMPRYPLEARAAVALTAYLRQLSAAPEPGVQGGTMHLATIVAPDAPEDRSRTVVETLRKWSDFGGFVRMPTRLHVWRLEGPEDTWRGQLDRWYRDRPVYAVISGAGGSRWRTVDEFCEQAGLPCLFPVVDEAPDDGGSHSLYLSSGIGLEAGMLARHLADDHPDGMRITQLYSDVVGAAAARRLAAQLPEVQTVGGDDTASLAEAFAALAPDDAVVAWLRPAQLQRLAERFPDGPGTRRLYLSAQLAPPDRTVLPPAWKRVAIWISARSDPHRLRGRTVLGLIPWLERIGLPLDDEATQSDVYGAIFYFADAQARMRGRINREYLLETIEATVDDRPAGASYYHLSLGPGQRFAAKGGHLLGYLPPDFQRLAPLGARIVPR